MMNTFSEGLVLADRSGLDPHTLLDVLVRLQPRIFALKHICLEPSC